LKSFENISRHSLIKLMAMASPAICGADPFLAVASYGEPSDGNSATNGSPHHPRLFYNEASLNRMRRMLQSNESSDSIQIATENLPLSVRWNGHHSGFAQYDKQKKLISLKFSLWAKTGEAGCSLIVRECGQRNIQ